MQQVTPDEAKTRLPDLISAALRGETILIGEGTDEIVQLVPVAPTRRPRKAGSAKGLIQMSDDFDDPLPDFEEYMR
jgi:antitoxin (DNA-binding transcriptional repressor) of toxin-antitoxin stability system